MTVAGVKQIDWIFQIFHRTASNFHQMLKVAKRYTSLKNGIENELLNNSSFGDDSNAKSPEKPTKNMEKEIPTM